jgi:peptidoglycan/LPS O-acetylase OafA/YrhL
VVIRAARTPPLSVEPSEYLGSLESLRGVAAWSIVTYHVWLFSSGARLHWNLGPLTLLMQPLQSGVTLFFVLSGFLLYRPWAASRGPRLGRYLRNRALRILPAYWFILTVATLAGAAIVRTSATWKLAGHLDPGRLLASGGLVQGYRPSTVFTGLPPAWSLGVEMAFYLLLPLAALLAARSAWLPPALLLGLGFGGKIGLNVAGLQGTRSFAPTWSSALSHGLLSHADLFGLGMCAAALYARWETPPAWIRAKSIGRLLAYVGLPWTVAAYYLVDPYLYDSGVAFFCALLLLRVLGRDERSLLETGLARAAGRISYSVFLWNYPLLVFLAAHGLLAPGHGPLALLANAAIVFASVAVLSTFTYRYVEAPALRLKAKRTDYKQAIPASA